MSSIGVYGPSGHGKSTGIRPPGGVGLNPDETFIICSDMKPLPFRGSKVLFPEVQDARGGLDITKSRYFTQDTFTKPDGGTVLRQATNAKAVLSIMKQLEGQQHIKNGVIDTLNHMMTHIMQSRAYEIGFDKFVDLGRQVYDILDWARKSRINWFILMHSADDYDKSGNLRTKVRTMGKLLDNNVDIASMFTVMLTPEVHKDELTGNVSFYFRTRTNGNDVTKSPEGMFPNLIPNDYGLVLKAMHAYENTVE